jgi:hypothetical protein
MKKKIWMNKAKTFEDAHKFDAVYYLNHTGTERVETIQILREEHFKSTGLMSRENGKRLRRVLRVIEQT